MLCTVCGSANTIMSYGSHPFDIGGLPHITIDAEISHCNECGEEELILRQLELMHLNIAFRLISNSSMSVLEKNFLIKYITSQYEILSGGEED